jgi:hypothetical protein
LPQVTLVNWYVVGPLRSGTVKLHVPSLKPSTWPQPPLASLTMKFKSTSTGNPEAVTTFPSTEQLAASVAFP